MESLLSLYSEPPPDKNEKAHLRAPTHTVVPRLLELRTVEHIPVQRHISAVGADVDPPRFRLGDVTERTESSMQP